MFNEEIKIKFIRAYTSSVSTSKFCETMFNATQPFEQTLKKDLSEMGSEDLSDVISSITSFRSKNKNARFILVKDYLDWCISNGISNPPNMMHQVRIDGITKIKQRTVSNPLHLQKYLDIIYDPEDKDSMDNVYRCYFWMAFMGIKEEDTVNITSDNVNFNTMTIEYNGMRFPIYRESIPAFKNIVELKGFKYYHPLYTDTPIRDRVPGNIIMRGVKSTPTALFLRTESSRRVNKLEDKAGMRLSYQRAWMSGVFYRTFQEESAGGIVDFTDIIDYKSDGKVYKISGDEKEMEKRRRSLNKDYMNDYITWKLAYRI